jgi:hypothetical protein
MLVELGPIDSPHKKSIVSDDNTCSKW